MLTYLLTVFRADSLSTLGLLQGKHCLLLWVSLCVSVWDHTDEDGYSPDWHGKLSVFAPFLGIHGHLLFNCRKMCVFIGCRLQQPVAVLLCLVVVLCDCIQCNIFGEFKVFTFVNDCCVVSQEKQESFSAEFGNFLVLVIGDIILKSN